MKACTIGWVAAAGTGIQTVTGVVDHNNAPFKGKAAIIHGSSTLNALTTNMKRSSGFDLDGGSKYGNASESSNALGLKLVNTGVAGNYSILAEHAQLGFGGLITRLAKIVAFRSGEFDVQYDLNTEPGDYICATIIGGDDISIALQQLAGSSVNPTVNVGFQPVAFISSIQQLFSASNATSGDASFGHGFAVSSGNRSAAATHSYDGALGNTRYITASKFAAQTDLTSVVDPRDVLAWLSNGFQSDGSSSGLYSIMSFGGVHAATGQILSPTTISNVTINPGFIPRILILVSTDLTANDSVSTGGCRWSFGMYDGVRQYGFWTGEDHTGAPATGARYTSNSDVLLFGTPNSSSSTFVSRAQATGINKSTGVITIHFSVADSNQRIINWFVLGDPAIPANAGAGIYKLVPGKRNDTVYTSQDPITTVDLDIPNPFAEGGLVGDEQ